MSVLLLVLGYTMIYHLSPREIPQAPPLGFPLALGDISLQCNAMQRIVYTSSSHNTLTVHEFPANEAKIPTQKS